MDGLTDGSGTHAHAPVHARHRTSTWWRTARTSSPARRWWTGSATWTSRVRASVVACCFFVYVHGVYEMGGQRGYQGCVLVKCWWLWVCVDRSLVVGCCWWAWRVCVQIDWFSPTPHPHPPIDTPLVNLATTLPLIDDARPIKQRVVVASFPERQNRMWRYFEQRRYQVRCPSWGTICGLVWGV